MYGRICDLVERNYQGYPLDEEKELGLTSDEAREVASRIFALFGVVRAKPAGAVEPPEGMDEAERQFYWASYHVHGGDADKMRAYADRLFVYRDVHLHVVPADGGDEDDEPIDEEVLEIIEEAVGEYLDLEARPKAEINEAAECASTWPGCDATSTAPAWPTGRRWPTPSWPPMASRRCPSPTTTWARSTAAWPPCAGSWATSGRTSPPDPSVVSWLPGGSGPGTADDHRPTIKPAGVPGGAAPFGAHGALDAGHIAGYNFGAADPCQICPTPQGSRRARRRPGRHKGGQLQ